MSIAETLVKAANLLQRRRWTQGVYARRNNVPCTPDNSAEQYDGLGAIRCVAKDGCWDAIAAVNAATRPQTFAEWQDAFGRTKGEVVEFLREVARGVD